MDAHVSVFDARERLDSALLAAMDRATSAPMRWGRDDCALFFADIIKDALGYDCAAPWRTGYTDRAGADLALGGLGLAFAFRKAAKQWGWRKIGVDEAMTGDVGLALVPTVIDGSIVQRVTTFVCRVPGWWVARSDAGYAVLDGRAIRVAWAVV